MELSAAMLAKIAEIADRPANDDEIVSLVVLRRPDPAGDDADIRPALLAAGQAHVTGLCAIGGVSPESIIVVSTDTNVEVDGATIQTGADILAAG